MSIRLKSNTQASERSVIVKMAILVKKEKVEEKKKESDVSLDQNINLCSAEAILEIKNKLRKKLSFYEDCEKDQILESKDRDETNQEVVLPSDRGTFIKTKEAQPMLLAGKALCNATGNATCEASGNATCKATKELGIRSLRWDPIDPWRSCKSCKHK